MDELELELKKLIVAALKLEGIAPEEIDSTEALFGGALGLDSIDALELGVALRKTYKLKIEPDADDVKEHFMNVHNLAKFIRSQRAEH
jgi:acyl carrier protein